jgi:hypothetical protein
MKSSEATLAQASALAARYGMPQKTVLDWMKAQAIEGFTGWMERYGPAKFRSNAESHDACYEDIVAWVMAK